MRKFSERTVSSPLSQKQKLPIVLSRKLIGTLERSRQSDGSHGGRWFLNWNCVIRWWSSWRWSHNFYCELRRWIIAVWTERESGSSTPLVNQPYFVTEEAQQSRVRYPCLWWLLRMVFFFPHVRQYNFGVQVIIVFFFCFEGVILCKYWQSPCRSTENPRVSHPRRRRSDRYFIFRILFRRVFEQSNLWFISCYSYLPAMHSGYQ